MRLPSLAAGALLAVAAAAATRPSGADVAPAPATDDETPGAAGGASGAGATPSAGDEAPASRYARLDPPACEAELERRGIPFAPAEARGVLAPVRFTGPLHGVTFRTALPEAQRASTPYEIVDCRLALALDDFAAQLAGHDVVEVVHYSIYRPPPARWPAEKIASRHLGGLAIDAATFVKRDGHTLVVERDFHGRIGARTCGAGAAPVHPSPDAVELRRILCDAADARLFNVTLTPDYNRAHRNHFHLEVTAGVRWFIVH
jgi:hypothetical protein